MFGDQLSSAAATARKFPFLDCVTQRHSVVFCLRQSICHSNLYLMLNHLFYRISPLNFRFAVLEGEQ